MSDLLRFWERVRRTDGCWLWTGATNVGGYGRFNIYGRTIAAHRLSYEATVGPIGPGLQIDHLCRNKLCVNPAHLEPVTQQENNRRSYSPSAVNARKTRCQHGHEMAGANLWVNPKTGYRQCRQCNNARRRASRKRTRRVA
jgi:hypothetical protein